MEKRKTFDAHAYSFSTMMQLFTKMLHMVGISLTQMYQMHNVAPVEKKCIPRKACNKYIEKTQSFKTHK